MHATVLKFDRKLGWGWALPDDPKQNDVFIHRCHLPKDRRFVLEGDRIEYELGEHNGQECAIKIRVTVDHPQVSAASAKAVLR